MRRSRAEKLEDLGTTLIAEQEISAQVEKEHFDLTMASFEGMKDKQLKKELKRELPTKGKTDDYMARLTSAARKRRRLS